MHKLCRLILISIVFLAVAMFPLSVRAQSSEIDKTATQSSAATTPLNLTISPITLYLQVGPGEVTNSTMKVRNNGSEIEHLSLGIGSFSADATGGNVQLLDEGADPESMSWLTLDKQSIEVSPGEWETINITFSPPSHAALAYYYTIIVSRSQSLQKPGETVIQGAPALLILATVNSPNARKELQLESFTAKHSMLEFLPQSFSLKMKNLGNVHIIPAGNIFIDGQGKKDLDVLTINEANSAVLPQTSRELTVTWDDGFPVWVENGKLHWDFSRVNRIRFGRYTAHVLLVYDNGQRDVPIESFVSFWVIPWRIILAGIAIPVAPALIVFVVMKWQVKRLRKKTP